MKPFEDDIKEFLESTISDAKTKLAGLLHFKPVIEALEEIFGRYNRYFLKDLLIVELEKIKQDKFFKEPDRINVNAKLSLNEDPIAKYNLFIWNKRILRRFSLYAFTRAWIEVLKENRETHKFIDEARSSFLLIMELYEVTKIGIHHFSSITLNSKDQKKAKSSSVGHIEAMLNPFREHISALSTSIKNLEANGWQEEKTINFFEYMAKLDFSEIEKDIFYGIINDFEVTKLFHGVQSKRHKKLLLCKLFRHTHPHLYHNQDSPKGNRKKDDLNLEGLSKLIDSPGRNLFH